MFQRLVSRFLVALVALAALGLVPVASAADEAADALIKRLSTEVLEAIKADKQIKAGELSRVVALVDQRIMPSVNFQRMTASAVGRNWRQATPEQQARLQEEFKILLVRTYAGALAQVSDQSIAMLWAGYDRDSQPLHPVDFSWRGRAISPRSAS